MIPKHWLSGWLASLFVVPWEATSTGGLTHHRNPGDPVVAQTAGMVRDMARAAGVALGMGVVLLALSACGLGASRGTMPPAGANGQVDPSSVPDFIAYVGGTDRIIGWVPKSYLLEPGQHCTGLQCDPIPVYADDLVTLIGHDVPGRGFVPVGVDPAALPEQPVLVGPSVGAQVSP